MIEELSQEPGAFALKLRLLTPRGVPLARRPFRVRWADALHPAPPHPPWQTDAHGALAVHLPPPSALAPAGELLFVDPDTFPERVIERLPLHIAVSSVQLAPSREQASFSQQALSPQQAPFPEQAPSREQAPSGEHALSAPAAIQEAALRLWNLADLPLSAPPTATSLAAADGPLRRALQRFAFRHGLPLPARSDPLAAVLACLPTLETVHDLRAPLVPGRPPRAGP